MKHVIFFSLISLVGSLSFANTSHTILCSNSEYSVELHVSDNKIVSYNVDGLVNNDSPFSWQSPDGTYNYSILVDDRNDTSTWFEIQFKDGQIIKRELAISGNDSDSYVGGTVAEGDSAFVCK